MTPIFHFNPEGCDDTRLDQRPLIYATDWSYQFEVIDERIKQLKDLHERKSSHDNEKKSRKNSFYSSEIKEKALPQISLKYI